MYAMGRNYNYMSLASARHSLHQLYNTILMAPLVTGHLILLHKTNELPLHVITTGDRKLYHMVRNLIYNSISLAEHAF